MPIDSADEIEDGDALTGGETPGLDELKVSSALIGKFHLASGDKEMDNDLRKVQNYSLDGESQLDVASDEARIRLRQHILTETEKRGETRFSDWESLSPEDRMANLERVLEIEQEIHPLRRDRDETTLGQFESDGYDFGKCSINGQRIEINSTLVSQGDALQNVSVLYHESKHVDQITALSNPMDDSHRAKVIEKELFYSADEYQDNYSELFIEAEARAAGRNGAEALSRVLSAGVEGGESHADGAMVDVDPDATDAEIAGANLICGGVDIPWEEAEDGEASETGDAGSESVPKPDTSGEPNQRERMYEPLSPEADEAGQKPLPPERDDNALISDSREKAEADGQEQRFDQVTAKKVAEWHGKQAEEQRQRQNEG